MDKRETMAVNETFDVLVQQLFEQQQKAGILYEDNGVTRANGMITAVYEKEGENWMQLNNELDIPVKALYAVNGVFSSGYSEC